MKYIGHDTTNHLMILELILGRDKILDYYANGNIDGLNDEIYRLLPESEASELINILEERLTKAYNGFFEKEEFYATGRIEELLIQLCRNSGQEDLAEILNITELNKLNDIIIYMDIDVDKVELQVFFSYGIKEEA